MIPSHCKVVGKLRLQGTITEEAVLAALVGQRAYKLTDYYCVTNGEGWAVIRVRRAPGPRLLVDIEGVDVLSLPGETRYVEDPSVDVTNPTAMLELLEREGGDVRCLVVQGEFNHMSFVLRDGTEVRVRVLDVVPPHPSKVAVLARRALECRPMPVLLEEETVDLRDLAGDVDPAARLLFPCRASDLELPGREVEFLDEVPGIDRGEEVVLVGCKLSERIFRTQYGFRPPAMVSMCPLELALQRPCDGWTLVKCCREKGPFGVHGTVMAIPWSATKGDAAAALEEIVLRVRARGGGQVGDEGGQA